MAPELPGILRRVSPPIHPPFRLQRRLGVGALAFAFAFAFVCSTAAAQADPAAPNGWQYAWRALRAQVPLPTSPTLVAYVADAGANGIRGYEVDAETGILTPLRAALAPTQDYPFAMAAHPSGKFIYVTNLRSNSISAFAVDAQTGGLRPLPGAGVATGAIPWAIAMHPAGSFAFVLNAASRSIATYAVDPSAGSLAETSAVEAELDAVPQAIAVAPDGRFVYVAMAGAHRLVGYAVDARTGALQRMPGPPMPLASAPESIQLEADGRLLHVRLNSGESPAYEVDPAQGSLSISKQVAQGAAPAEAPRGTALDPHGHYAFVIERDAHAIRTYRIDPATGRRSAAVQSTTDGGSLPLGIVVVPLRPATPLSS